jgi:hypothetical protein
MEYPPEDILPAPKLPRPVEVVDNTPLMAQVWKITSDLRLARLTRPGKISSTSANEEGLSLTPVEIKIGIDSEVDPRSEAYDRQWNARLTGPAPNYFESGLAVGAEEFGGVTSVFPYEQVDQAKVCITSNLTQLRLRYDMGNYLAARVQPTGFTEMFCIGQTDPGLHIITGGGDSASVQGGLTINFGNVLRRLLSFSLAGSFGGGGTAGLASTSEQIFTVTLPAGVSLTSGFTIVAVSPTTDPGGQVMSWSARIHSATQIAVKFSYFDVLGAFAPTWNAVVLQFV